MKLSDFPYTNRCKVLLIDDEVDLCMLMRQYFLRKNYEVFISHTGKDAISQAAAYQPDYILLDTNLPDGCRNLEQQLKEAAPNARITHIGK
ncbi:Response regulator receiver domain-containing protein [Cnuella takakiae]|uniref:Response regulator receiver domain-containing protein n=1 Tax=Cnuella takakiae TaxID=1302690 RepID=A0A1M5EHB8_9BACT|nr:response regulator [Cnuella takakiae]OLY91175.1 hypothetical protein BUE76_04125 [Cnuella takakiae]SHF78524.1 Response regulator receiver domain-containing protein [Cnuella takakiae]